MQAQWSTCTLRIEEQAVRVAPRLLWVISGLASCGHECSQAGHVIDGSDAVVEVVVEANAELAGSHGQGQKCVPSLGASEGADAAADLATAHPGAEVAFDLVGMQWHFRVVERDQQLCLLGAGEGDALIQGPVVGLASEEFLKVVRRRWLSCGLGL